MAERVGGAFFATLACDAMNWLPLQLLLIAILRWINAEGSGAPSLTTYASHERDTRRDANAALIGGIALATMAPTPAARPKSCNCRPLKQKAENR